MKEVYSYSKEIHERYPYLKDMLLYQQALCALVEIDNNNVNITGMEGDYLSKTPDDVGIYDYKWNGVSIRPVTSSFVK